MESVESSCYDKLQGQVPTWKAVGVPTEVHDRLVPLRLARQLRGRLLKQLLDAAVESGLIADHSLVHGHPGGAPRRLQQLYKLLGALDGAPNVQNLHACKSDSQNVQLLCIIVLLHQARLHISKQVKCAWGSLSARAQRTKSGKN